MRISDTFFKKADMDFLFFCLSVCLSVRQLKQTAMKGNWAKARGDGILSRVRTGFHPVRSIREIPSHIRNIWIEFPLFADVRAWVWSKCVKEMESHGDKPDEIESRQNRRPCSRALAQFPFIAVCFS
jgi:hypothetical protein